MDRHKLFPLDQVAIRLVKEPPLYSQVPFSEPKIVAGVMGEALKDYDREVVAVVNVRADLCPINVNIVSIGTLEQSLIHPRELLKSTILSNASSILLVHNHPSGNLTPSAEDIKVTDRMVQITQLMEITLLDHIIVGRGSEYYSFREKAVLPLPKITFTSNIEEIDLGGSKVAEQNNFKENSPEKKESYLEQMKEITDKLEKGVTEIFNSENYKKFLDTMAKFPRYSVNNNLLIMMQKPEAQMCQSFTGWKEMGRFVKKGEEGIKIIAPASYTVEREIQKMDAKGNPVYGTDGNPVMEQAQIKKNGFKVVHTFDISQTEGKELPSLGVDQLQGEVKEYEKFFAVIKEISPVPIEVKALKDGSKGYYSPVEKKIVLHEGMSEIQNVKTLIHEIAHAKLHSEKSSGNEKTRNSKEVEAESVAYTVCQHYGIDTSDYSFSYVVGWSGGKEVPELKESLDTIRRAASEMITVIDEKLEELAREKEKDQIVAQNVTKLQGVDYQYSKGAREEEYTFSCEVKGVPDILTYTRSYHDDGEGYTIYTEKKDIWEVMSEPELRKLEESVRQAAHVYQWERRIDGIKELTDVEHVKAGLVEEGTSRTTKEQRETRAKKTSVKSKLQEEKEKVRKTERPKKIKDKNLGEEI